MKKSILNTSGLIILSCMTAQGQQDKKAMEEPGIDTIHMEEVSIAVLPFQERYQEATGGVFVLGSAELRKLLSRSSTELYDLAPGVYVASGTLNTQRMVIRGVGSRTPYNTNRIRAYLDDIPLTSGDGISTLEDLDLYSIGKLEILKGPSSALYGSGLGGVVRLNSPYPSRDGFTGALITEFGSFRSRKYGLTGTFKKNMWALTGGLSRSSTEGYRDNSEYVRTNAYFNARRFGRIHNLSLTLSLVDLYAEIPSSLNETDYMNNPERAGGSWGQIRGFEEYVKFLSGIRIESRLSKDLKNNFTLFSTISDPFERRPFNTLDDHIFNLGFREYLEYGSRRIKFRTGMEYFHEWYDWQIYETLPEGRGDLVADHSEIRKYLNGFALAQWKPGDRLLVDAGFNVNLLNYSLQTNYRADSTDQSGAYRYAPVFSPRVGLSYRHSNSIWSYVSAGHGFSAPSLEETLLPEGSINTSLRPETGWNLELGNRGSMFGGQVQYDLAVYCIFLRDMLVTERITEDIFTGINAGSARNTGMEVLVKGSLFPETVTSGFNSTLSLAYNLSANRFTDFVNDGMDYSGNTLPGIPVQELNGVLTGLFAGFEIQIQHKYSGSQWMDDGNRQLYEGHHITDLRLSYDLQIASAPIRLSVQGGIRNLFDVEYASMILINAPSFGGSDPRYYYPGLPRQFHLGLKLAYE